jgi:cyclopropane-fatty-acyl-phospholipid synthase
MAVRTGVLVGGARGSHVLRDVFAAAGVEIGGNRPFDLRVHDDRFYDRVLSQGALGFGESYMDGWWGGTASTSTR